jgi:hypothetical protein
VYGHAYHIEQELSSLSEYVSSAMVLVRFMLLYLLFSRSCFVDNLFSFLLLAIAMSVLRITDSD